MKKRLLVLTLVMALAIGVITPAAVAAKELKVWVSTGPETEWMNRVAKIYEEKTGIKIKVESVAELDQAQRLSLDGPSGKGADIVGWPHDKLGRSVIQGLLEPIESYFPKGYFKENYLENAIDALTYEGKIYGLPYAYQSVALVYNKDLMPKPAKNFEDFIAQAKEITDPSKNQYGFLFRPDDFYFTAGFFLGYGAYIFGENPDGTVDVTDVGLGNEGAIKAAKFLKRFRDEGLVPKGIDGNTLKGLFSEGKVGAIITGDWDLKDFEEAGVNYGVAPLPKLPNGKYPKTFVTAKGFYMSKFSKDKEAAADFLKFITNAKMSMDHYKEANIFVPHKEVASSERIMNDRDLLPFIIQARRGVPMPNVPEMMSVWSPANNAMVFVLDGKAEAEMIMPMTVDMIVEGIMQMR
ncbi:extracellular solute-binding protein [Orenia marismortui]|uniref:extracellular solute-binding protein n=1 Tax=Orenia marismortui TaxID=46469 RepID=UPI00037D4771|nr:extracellular solute-binding protein [Orenia marismortui]